MGRKAEDSAVCAEQNSISLPLQHLSMQNTLIKSIQSQQHFLQQTELLRVTNC